LVIASYKKQKFEQRILLSIVLGIFLSWRGFLETLSYGQVDLLLGAGLLWITSSTIDSRKEGARGSAIFRVFLWALLLTVKPHMALILLPACLAFGWKECLRVLALTLVMYLLPTLWIGTDSMITLFREWIACLREQQGVAFMTGNINQAVGAVLARLSDQLESVGLLGALGILIYASVFGILALPNIRHSLCKEQSTEVKLCWMTYGISGYLLFSPLSWRWFVFLWVPVVAIISYLEEQSIKLLSAWALLAVLTNGAIAYLLGLSAADRVSFFGLYMWASCVLFLVTIVQLRKHQVVV
jgi:hypothetical protein